MSLGRGRISTLGATSSEEVLVWLKLDHFDITKLTLCQVIYHRAKPLISPTEKNFKKKKKLMTICRRNPQNVEKSHARVKNKLVAAYIIEVLNILSLHEPKNWSKIIHLGW